MYCPLVNPALHLDQYTAWPKKWHHFLYALSSSNINRFSKFFHCQNQEKICNNTITVTKDPTTLKAYKKMVPFLGHPNEHFSSSQSYVPALLAGNGIGV